ncbi:MAG: efflux transporter periplasmic adaptor subunit [Flavobacterium sp. BFFFF2]|nr:MAG: efflux transporter periplasmic adaptor subunit [Flavobacterium sp. BFFFF2]
MLRNALKIGLLTALLVGCQKEEKKNNDADFSPVVTENGTKIAFPEAQSTTFFETETIGSGQVVASMNAPAKVAATVVVSHEGASRNLILFDNPELSGNYTLLIQHQSNINQLETVTVKQRRIELDRAKDLQAHGAASGRELLEAQTALAMELTNLANERAAIIEHETKLKAGGFEPDALRKAQSGQAYIICDIPENEISRIPENSICQLHFTAYPNETFQGRIEDVADMVDQTTRMIKLRVGVNNASGKLKAGMFATVDFGIKEGKNMTVNKSAMITIQAKNYVFVKTDNKHFELREINAGDQVNDRMIIYTGIKPGEQVVVKGVMQLKGLSFGY